MARYVEYKLESGGTLLVEVGDDAADEEWAPESVKAGVGDKVRETILAPAKVKFSEALADVRDSAQELLSTLADLAADEIEVKFGIKATGELGGVFALSKAGGEFTYEVTLRWSKPEATANRS